jgi:signal transduction histidine kinase
VYDIFSGESAKTLHANDRELLKNKGVQNFELQLELLNGDTTDVIIHQTSFINYDGQIIGLVGGILSVTDTHIIERKLEQYTEELTKSNANKDRFFSIIAHDLKNPFITLLGYTEALIEDYYEMSSEEHLDYLKQIQRTSKNSYQLLENLLQWSRSQSGKLKIEPVYFNLHEVVEEVVSLKMSACDAKSIELINEVGKDLSVFADKDTVKTIMRNLIGNAVKFTNDKGKIEILNEIQNEFAVISVRDNGIGISEDDQINIFNIDKFHSTLGTRNEHGTGLGLVLCQEFVTKNNGKIWVESILNEGSTFYFSLPLKNN